MERVRLKRKTTYFKNSFFFFFNIVIPNLRHDAVVYYTVFTALGSKM